MSFFDLTKDEIEILREILSEEINAINKAATERGYYAIAEHEDVIHLGRIRAKLRFLETKSDKEEKEEDEERARA